jgi:hypothetical protein
MACVPMVHVRGAAGGVTAGPAPERVPTWREVLQNCVDVASFRATLTRQDVGNRESRRVNAGYLLSLQLSTPGAGLVGPPPGALVRGPARSSACELEAVLCCPGPFDTWQQPGFTGAPKASPPAPHAPSH